MIRPLVYCGSLLIVILLVICSLLTGQNASIYALSPEDARRGRDLYARQEKAEQAFALWRSGIERQLSGGAPLEFNSSFELAQLAVGMARADSPTNEQRSPDADSPVKGEPCDSSSSAVGMPLGSTNGRFVVWACVNGLWVIQ